MTLLQFLASTAARADEDVRPAMAMALKVEVPRSREGYARFYRRVIAELVRLRRGRPCWSVSRRRCHGISGSCAMSDGCGLDEMAGGDRGRLGSKLPAPCSCPT